MRPRIRTLKPEMWADERVGDLSHGARLLFIGLITMADDHGRVRELSAAILGHVFPYDKISNAKLARWLREVEASGMIVRYTVGEKRYVAFRRWDRHQKVDRGNKSELPAPPDFDDRSTINRRSFDDRSCSPRGGAHPVRSSPGPAVDVSNDNGSGSARPDEVDTLDAIWGHYQAARKRAIPRSSGCKLGDVERRLIRNALKVRSPEDCRAAIDGLFRSVHHREGGYIGLKYALLGGGRSPDPGTTIDRLANGVGAGNVVAMRVSASDLIRKLNESEAS